MKKSNFWNLEKNHFVRSSGIKREPFFNLIADSESYKPQQKVLSTQTEKSERYLVSKFVQRKVAKSSQFTLNVKNSTGGQLVAGGQRRVLRTM